MSKPISYKSLTLDAYERRRVDVTGQIFVCTACSGVLLTRMDNGEEFPITAGFVLEPGQFKSLEFYNDSATATTIEFYTGTSIVSYLGNDMVRARGSDLKPLPFQTLDANGGVYDLPGTWDGRARKQVIVSNMDTNEIIYVGSAAVPTAPVFPRTSWTVETDSFLRILNAAASQVQVAIAEFFYR